MLWLTLTLEAFSFVLALLQNHMLAHKKRHAWGVYVAFSIITVILFSLKSSYITVINQAYLGITAIYPWINWNEKKHSFQKYLNWIGWGVFLCSFSFFRFSDIGDCFEIASWFFIYMKNNMTRTENATGWIYAMIQKILTIIFNILRMNYILALRNAIQLGQAIYGYKKWKTPPDILKTGI